MLNITGSLNVRTKVRSTALKCLDVMVAPSFGTER